MLLSAAAADGGRGRGTSANAPAAHCQGVLRADVAPIIKHRSQRESATGRCMASTGAARAPLAVNRQQA